MMKPWKFYCEAKSDIPLPPTYTFPQAFNYLNSKSNSFYILEHEDGDYMQCGGSKEACCVELRLYAEDRSFKHYVVGRRVGSDAPASIKMSAGIVNIQEREVFTHWQAIEFFKKFFAGEPLHPEHSLREVAL